MDVKYVIPVGLGEAGSDSVPRRKDMAKSKFVWLAGDTFTRSRDGRGGIKLERGGEYDAGAFNPEVVEEWVRAGAAEYAGGKKPAKGV
jgi:hypothetical protein